MRKRYFACQRLQENLQIKPNTRIFNLQKSSSRTVVLVLNQTLAEMSTINIPEGKVWPMRLITSQQSMSRYSRQCVSLKVSQSYGPPKYASWMILAYIKHWLYYKSAVNCRRQFCCEELFGKSSCSRNLEAGY